MASSNLDLVRSIYEDWERGDFTSAEWAYPEIEYVQADGPDAGTWNGMAGMAAAFDDYLSAWQEWRVKAEEYVELDEERVLVPYHFSARGKTSDADVGQMRARGASLFHIRDGKVTRIVQHMDRERARTELGLAPEAHLP